MVSKRVANGEASWQKAWTLMALRSSRLFREQNQLYGNFAFKKFTNAKVQLDLHLPKKLFFLIEESRSSKKKYLRLVSRTSNQQNSESEKHIAFTRFPRIVRFRYPMWDTNTASSQVHKGNSPPKDSWMNNAHRVVEKVHEKRYDEHDEGNN